MKLPRTLSDRQTELLERVCLKRYEVRFAHYMGRLQPNESVDVRDLEHEGDGWAYDRSFRPTTVEALRSRGLVRFENAGQASSLIKPTSAGLSLFRVGRDSEAAVARNMAKAQVSADA